MENNDHTQLMHDKFIELSRILQDFQKATFNEWSEKMNREANDYLKEYILGRSEFQDLQVNFSYDSIPGPAKNLFDIKDEFRQNLIHLDMIFSSYNKILTVVNGVEMNLMDTQMSKIDSLISQGEKSIKWNSSSKP